MTKWYYARTPVGKNRPSIYKFDTQQEAEDNQTLIAANFPSDGYGPAFSAADGYLDTLPQVVMIVSWGQGDVEVWTDGKTYPIS